MDAHDVENDIRRAIERSRETAAMEALARGDVDELPRFE